jgi:uncharacterized protein
MSKTNISSTDALLVVFHWTCAGALLASALTGLRITANPPAAFRLRLGHALAALMLIIAVLMGTPAGALEPGSLVIETRSGVRHPFEIELATRPEDIEHGLMFRDAMAPDHGMLFDFGKVQSVTFWMKNTKLPLDMLFIAEDGQIVGITPDAVPYSEDLIPSPKPVRAVLELNAGTAERLGIAVGDQVVHTFPAPISPLADSQLLHDVAGRWHMEAKERDALVPNIVLVLRSDGNFEFFRDDSGGMNFSLYFWGAWAPSSPAPGQVEISFHYIGVQPERFCFPLPGRCEYYEVPFHEKWTFTKINSNRMETPGAVWHREPLL